MDRAWQDKKLQDWQRRMVERWLEDQLPDAMLCPKCGAECGRDEADVGVGIIYGPWGCPCGWSSSAEYDVSEGPKLAEAGYVVDQQGGLTPL